MTMDKLIALLFIFLSLPAFGQRSNPESFYVNEWCNRYAGEQEVVLEDRTRVDCVTYYHAIEFDFADKWAEAIGQALHYSIMTGKRAGIVLIVEDPGAMRYVERVRNIVVEYSLPVEIWVTD
jgi:hypothetical protein